MGHTTHVDQSGVQERCTSDVEGFWEYARISSRFVAVTIDLTLLEYTSDTVAL